MLTIYPIREADGELVAEKVRIDNPDGTKRIHWNKSLHYALQDLPLYRLPQLAKSEPDSTVVVTEGEKAADSLARRGILAVGTVTGASVTPSPRRLEVLTGHDVVLWADNDDVGRAHMRTISYLIRDAHPRWIEVEGAHPHDDAADYNGDIRSLIANALPCPWLEPEAEIKRLQGEVAKLKTALDQEKADHRATRKIMHTNPPQNGGVNLAALVKSKLDLVIFMADYGFDLKKQGNVWVCCCPFHADRTPSMAIYDDNHWFCYGCGFGGDVFEFLKKQGIRFPDAVKAIAGYLGMAR